MITLPLSEIAAVVRGELHGRDVLVRGAAYVDSREGVPDGLYVALVGERVDGHLYADGAHAVLGSRPTGAPTVVVDDVTVALGRLAELTVGTLGVPVLAVTGSQGKTGTKDYLAHLLGPTAVATRGNNNNELGVPLTVLRAEESTTTHLVLEMGARGVGHLAYLCQVAPPTVAAVLNVGTAHVGEFGGVEAIAAAKGELVEALDADGTAVLNADDPRVAAMVSRTRARILTFGADGLNDPDVAFRDVSLDALGRATFDLGHDGAWVRVALRQTGAHQVANATAAAAMALAVGVPLETVAERLATAEAASRWRMELTERADGLLVLNDSYNANPASMRAALDAVRALGAERAGRTVAVLGEMRELGPEHEAGHREVGDAAHGLDVVVVVGEAAHGIADGARTAGVGEVIVTAGRDDALAWVRKNAGAGDVVLVKASRAAELEVLAAALLETPTGDTP